jgi:uncharacterized coiled-coil DUF342 family protein
MKEDLIKAVKAALLPELAELKSVLALTNQRLDDTNKRLDDMNARLVDQSRRIDSVRESLENRFEALRTAVDDRFKTINGRLDQLYEIVVRREEHYLLANRVQALEQELAKLKERFAA